jgi:hypothetical protein
VDKPKIFDRILYTSIERPIGSPYAVFKLLDANEDAYRHPHAKLIHIAGMVRHAAIQRMEADPPSWIEHPADWINRVVRGKRDESSTVEHRQFSYVPLPSIGHEHADAMIRNVMVVAPMGMDREFTNEYHYGDFHGNAEEMLRHGYDAHLHYANFGIRRLMIRLPAGLPCDRRTFDAFRAGRTVEWLAPRICPR